jgi:dihydrofolate reductase
MRKIILNLAVSLDGFIEGPDGNYDWCFTDQDYGMTEFYNTTDAIFVGRKSFEMINADPTAFADKKIYVFSDTLTGELPANVEVIPSKDYLQRVDEITKLPGENIWLFGGASLVSGFVNNGLINELLISLHPVILGGGRPLFENIKNKMELALIDHQVFSSGLVQLSYVKQPKFDFTILGNM